jgi:hypothetical protein
MRVRLNGQPWMMVHGFWNMLCPFRIAPAARVVSTVARKRRI